MTKNRYFSTKLIKKKTRKYTTNELDRNNTNIKSPKKTSPCKTYKNSGKKINDKNKNINDKIINRINQMEKIILIFYIISMKVK